MEEPSIIPETPSLVEKPPKAAKSENEKALERLEKSPLARFPLAGKKEFLKTPELTLYLE